jgi:Transcription factor Opi1
VAAQRILALATESLDMTRNVTGVIKHSFDRAELFFHSIFMEYRFISKSVGRLRTAGIQRDTQVEDTDTSAYEFHNGVNIVATNLIKIYLVHLFSRRLLRFGARVYLLHRQEIFLRLLVRLVLVA